MIKRRRYRCLLVAGKAGLLTSRCGREFKQGKGAGLPEGITVFRADCPDCEAATKEIVERLTTSVA